MSVQPPSSVPYKIVPFESKYAEYFAYSFTNQTYAQNLFDKICPKPPIPTPIPTLSKTEYNFSSSVKLFEHDDNGVKTTRVSVYSTWPDETIKIRKIAENMFENHTAIPNADSTSPISDDSENNFRKPESLSSPASNELNSFSAGTAEKTL